MFQQSLVPVGSLHLNHAAGPAHGPSLLLLHGVLRRWQTFHPLLPHFPRWQLHGLDFPGHGASDRLSGEYRVADYIRVTAEFVRQFQEPLVIYGHSLGAMVTAGIASELGDRVRAVILEDPPFETMGTRIRETFLHGYFSSLQRFAGSTKPRDDLARDLADVLVTDPKTGTAVRLGEQRDAAQLRFMASCLAQLDPKVLDPIVGCRWLEGYDWRGVFSKLRCPTLLLQADTTVAGMLADEDVREVLIASNHVTLVKLHSCGHNMHWARTQDVANLANAFLESL